MQQKPPPYIYEYFNVFCFFTSHRQFQNNIIARVQNAIVKAFNRREKLPKYIIMILNSDLLESTNHFTYGVKSMLVRWVSYLSKFIEKCISICKEQLFKIHPGAVVGANPRVVWVKMINKPQVPPTDACYRIQLLTHKFNTVIDDLTKAKRGNHTMMIRALEDPHFLPTGYLNQFGQMQFWKEFDYHFKRFDRREITLLPGDGNTRK